jgi:hypothetical protein
MQPTQTVTVFSPKFGRDITCNADDVARFAAPVAPEAPSGAPAAPLDEAGADSGEQAPPIDPVEPTEPVKRGPGRPPKAR